ncbi:fnip repeat-containing protein [Moumouvirus maliensis]|nr:fnip repeat-containing protein [Moumouvirus maliensis]
MDIIKKFENYYYSIILNDTIIIMSIINTLNPDVILYIFDHLSDKDKIMICSTNKYFREYLEHIQFYGLYDYNKIKNLSYYARFRYIEYMVDNINISKGITHLTFINQVDQSIKKNIPLGEYITNNSPNKQKIYKFLYNGLTHLTFGCDFNQPIKEYIPDTVTHLKFGKCFNQPIKDCIPKSVTHLTFGYLFNQSIEGCIPNNVIHLTTSVSFLMANNQYINPNTKVKTYWYYN